MERRQPLDFNVPLLSIRRYSSPLCSSEMLKPTIRDKPGDKIEVTKPASVPFRWEQIPGTPKYEIKSQRLSDSARFISGEIPKPPPGRLSSGPSRFATGERSSDEAFHASLVEKLKESLKCDNAESDEDAHSDALDKLSCSESQYLNCSDSGVSGSHDSMMVTKPSGTFSVDAQTKELMLHRFLPAAKAAVLEKPPQYNAKKPSTAEKPVKKAVSGKIEKPLVSEIAEPYYSRQYINTEESEDGDSDHRSPIPSKRWGIIPRFCVKNSLCLLNPLPGLRSKSRPQTPSTGEVRKLTRNSLSGPLDKIASPVTHKKKFHSGLLSREIASIESKLSKEPDRFSKPRDSHSSAASSPLRRYRSGNLTPPHRNEVLKSPLPKEIDDCLNDNKLVSSRKLFKALADVSKNQKIRKGSSGRILCNGDNKTPYVDPLCKSDRFSPISKPFLPKAGEPQTLQVSEVGSEVKRVIKEERKLESQLSLRASDITLNSTLAPLLPKSPSESWLWRTVPSGNSSAHSSWESPVRLKNQGPKWEAIVKSSNRQRNRVHFSQELTPRPSSQREANS